MEAIGPDGGIWHYDGRNALRHEPRVSWDDHGCYLEWPDGRSGPHRWHLLRPLSGKPGQMLFGLEGNPGWRLGFAEPPPAGFTQHLPRPARYGGFIDSLGLWKAAAISAVLAAAVVAVIVNVPAWVAPLIPRSWENRMGDAMVGDLGGRLCETPASRAALDKLTRQLTQGTQVRQVAIANVPMVNAITLPGARILIFDKLISDAKSPDELAGVLAHEIGHVRHRDTVTALVRQLGLSAVLGGLNGDVGGLLNGVMAMSYSREAERAADQFSIDALARADVSPLPTAGFFHALGGGRSGGGKMERVAGWMDSHPVSADRETAFKRAAVKGHRYRVALEPAEWAALRNACRDDPRVKKDEGFQFNF